MSASGAVRVIRQIEIVWPKRRAPGTEDVAVNQVLVIDEP